MATISDINSYWKQILSSQQSGTQPGVFALDRSHPYPSEAAMDFVSAFMITGESKYEEAARRQLEYAHCQETDQLLIFDGLFQRDSHSRQIYNFAVAARILNDSKYLQWATDCAEAMAPHTITRPTKNWMKRQNYTFDYMKGTPSPGGLPNEYELFWATYQTDASGSYLPTVPGKWPRGVVDPNQNAAIALGFTLLYEKNIFVIPQQSTLRLIQDELVATLRLHEWQQYGEAFEPFQQDDAGDADRQHFTVYPWLLPMNDSQVRRRNYDTMYASITFFYWALCRSYWKGIPNSVTTLGSMLYPGLKRARDQFLDPAVAYQRIYPSASGRSRRVFPARYDDLWYRVGLFWEAGEDEYKDERNEMASRAADSVVQILPGVGSGFPSHGTPFCYFSLLGMKPADYLPAQ